MSHMFERGFTVRQPAWHAAETGCHTLSDYPGMKEGMRIAGHDFQVEEAQISRTQMVNGTQVHIPISGWKALLRNDNQNVIAVMKDSYEVIQNDIPWSLIDTLFQQGAKWDTAGTLKGRFDENHQTVKGQVYWCLALLDEPRLVLGDDSPIYPYLAATWSHDGSQSLRFRFMDVRIVCANTHVAAMYGSNGMDLDVSIRHYGNIEERVAKVKEAIQMARNNHNAFMEMANDLARMPVSEQGIEEFISRVIPMPEANIITDRVRGNVFKSREQMRNIFNSATIAGGIRNTAYGLVESGVEYLDHVRKAMNRDVYFTRNCIKASPAKLQLVELAREVAAGMAV